MFIDKFGPLAELCNAGRTGYRPIMNDARPLCLRMRNLVKIALTIRLKLKALPVPLIKNKLRSAKLTV